jgi:hypothetical protein
MNKKPKDPKPREASRKRTVDRGTPLSNPEKRGGVGNDSAPADPPDPPRERGVKKGGG